ncbi:MAG: hypothetical protein HKN47_08845 [Pirellulaceae bacterium]|nr:hypothetical protein [Pirellulaceae bacterium]
MNEELAQVSRATVSREDRIIELKNEVNDLLKRLGQQTKYKAHLTSQ